MAGRGGGVGRGVFGFGVVFRSWVFLFLCKEEAGISRNQGLGFGLPCLGELQPTFLPRLPRKTEVLRGTFTLATTVILRQRQTFFLS